MASYSEASERPSKDLEGASRCVGEAFGEGTKPLAVAGKVPIGSLLIGPGSCPIGVSGNGSRGSNFRCFTTHFAGNAAPGPRAQLRSPALSGGFRRSWLELARVRSARVPKTFRAQIKGRLIRGRGSLFGQAPKYLPVLAPPIGRLGRGKGQGLWHCTVWRWSVRPQTAPHRVPLALSACFSAGKPLPSGSLALLGSWPATVLFSSVFACPQQEGQGPQQHSRICPGVGPQGWCLSLLGAPHGGPSCEADAQQGSRPVSITSRVHREERASRHASAWPLGVIDLHPEIQPIEASSSRRRLRGEPSVVKLLPARRGRRLKLHSAERMWRHARAFLPDQPCRRISRTGNVIGRASPAWGRRHIREGREAPVASLSVGGVSTTTHQNLPSLISSSSTSRRREAVAYVLCSPTGLQGFKYTTDATL